MKRDPNMIGPDPFSLFPPSADHLIESRGFFRKGNAVFCVLQCRDVIPEAASVLEMLPGSAEVSQKPLFPVVVLEGLDATGKSCYFIGVD